MGVETNSKQCHFDHKTWDIIFNQSKKKVDVVSDGPNGSQVPDIGSILTDLRVCLISSTKLAPGRPMLKYCWIDAQILLAVKLLYLFGVNCVLTPASLEKDFGRVKLNH